MFLVTDAQPLVCQDAAGDSCLFVRPDRNKRVPCCFCEHEIELSERDLRWIDAKIAHGDVRAGENYVRPPFNFACQSCRRVFTYDYKPPLSSESPVPLPQPFCVEQVACEGCGSLMDIIVVSPTRTTWSETRTWKQSWVKHKPWHRSA